MARTARLSGLQRDVLSLYRRCLRAARLKPDTVVMHAGPMNRGVEIAAEVADSPASIITEQVANGVAVRMAVLWSLLGSGGLVA